MNNENTKLLDAYRSMQAAVHALSEAVDYLSIVTVEQIGTHTVVSTDFVLPEYWYVENCPEATEWAYSVIPKAKEDARQSCDAIRSDAYGFNYSTIGIIRETQITRDQFITHVYLPWKESLKPKYWKCLGKGWNPTFEQGIIYPENAPSGFSLRNVSYFATRSIFSDEWQPATESEYLAQEAAKQANYDVSNVSEPKYLRCVSNEYVLFKNGEIYPISLVENRIVNRTESNWQPATESEYLAQEAAKQPEQGAPFDEVKTQRPNYDISNVTEPKFKAGDYVEATKYFLEVQPGDKGKVERVITDGEPRFVAYFDRIGKTRCLYFEQAKLIDPPKFDPATADKTKMYFAVHEHKGDGAYIYSSIFSTWVFTDNKGGQFALSPNELTHIDHEPIQRRN